MITKIINSFKFNNLTFGKVYNTYMIIVILIMAYYNEYLYGGILFILYFIGISIHFYMLKYTNPNTGLFGILIKNIINNE